MRLRSVELEVPDPDAAAAFLIGPWGALPADGGGPFVRGTVALPYLVGFRAAAEPSIDTITFEAPAERVAAIAERARAAGLPVDQVIADEPGGGRGVVVSLPDGERFRFLSGCADAAPADAADAPAKLTHVVLNAVDAERSADLCERLFGFRVSDRTAGMVFVRCNRAHHSVAFARAGHCSLNHIAFEMRDIDAVMRGIGRMRDIGLAPAWGPGRHGPGDNVFGYFIAPFGAVIEYSSPVAEVEDDYRTGTPADWTWPADRIDRWGVSAKDVAALTLAERRFRFRERAASEVAA